MQRYENTSGGNTMTECADGDWYHQSDVAGLQYEIAHVKEERDSQQRCAIQAMTERDTLREVLALLAPDLKAMAILYAAKGDHQRSQALYNICKSVGVV